MHLPYARHIDASALELRYGLLMQTIHLGGLLFETADSGLNYRPELRDAMLRAVGSSRFAIYHHLIRRRADVALDAAYTDPVLAGSRPALATGAVASQVLTLSTELEQKAGVLESQVLKFPSHVRAA